MSRTCPEEPAASCYSRDCFITCQWQLSNLAKSKDKTICFGIPTPANPAPRVAAPAVGLEATLAERGSRYGSFVSHAGIAEKFVGVMTSEPGYAKLAPDQRQSFRMFADKMARILSGDPDYSDSWHDIAGYATLVDKRLKLAGK